MLHIGGIPAYIKICDDVVADNYRGSNSVSRIRWGLTADMPGGLDQITPTAFSTY